MSHEALGDVIKQVESGRFFLDQPQNEIDGNEPSYRHLCATKRPCRKAGFRGYWTVRFKVMGRTAPPELAVTVRVKLDEGGGVTAASATCCSEGERNQQKRERGVNESQWSEAGTL